MIYSFVKSYYIMKSFSLTKRWRNSWTQMYHKTRQFLNPFLFTYTYLISKTMALSFLNFHNMWFCYFFINLIFHVYLNLLAADHFLPEKRFSMSSDILSEKLRCYFCQLIFGKVHVEGLLKDYGWTFSRFIISLNLDIYEFGLKNYYLCSHKLL